MSRFGLRKLLVLIVPVAIAAGVLRTQVIGELEVRRPDATLRQARMNIGFAPFLQFTCESSDSAQQLAAEIDPVHIRSISLKRLTKSSPQARDGLYYLEFEDPVVRGCLVQLNYHAADWYRYRLQLHRFSYITDFEDPVANARNDAVHFALDAAAKEVARSEPAIISCTTYADFLVKVAAARIQSQGN